MATILEGGTVEIPPAGGEGETVQEPPAAKVEDPPPGETPAPVVEDPPAKVEEVVETRTAEQIEVDQAAAVAAVVEAGGDEAAQAAAAEAAAQPVVAPVVEEPTGEDDIKGIERPRFKDARDQLIAGLYKKAQADGKPISWAEAEARIDGPKAEAKASGEAAPVVIQSTKIAETVKTLGEEVAALAQKIEDASDEVLPTRELAKLTTEHATKSAQLAAAEGRLEDAKASEKAALKASSDAARSTATAEATSEDGGWPDAANPNSALAKAIDAEITALNDGNHPDHSILWADSAPLLITQRVAKRLGIPPSVKKAAPSLPAKPAVVTPPRKIVAPVSAAKTAVPATTQPAEDAKATIEKAKAGELTVEEMDRMQGGGSIGELLAGVAR